MSLDNKVVDLADLKVSHDYLLGQDELLSDRINELGSGIDGIQSQITALGNGSPIPVETVAEMTDNTKAYLYTGSEQGHTSGYWYTYDSTQAKFVPRGEYGAGVIIDSTLTVTGNAADAKATGDAIKAGKTFVVHVPGSAAVLSGSITAGDFAKALAAYTAGSGVYAVKDGEVYQLSAASSSTMTFTQMYHGTMNFIKQIQITSADTFTVTNTALSSSATDTSYSNTASGLTATNVQEAIDESAASLSNVNGRLDWLDCAKLFKNGFYNTAGTYIGAFTEGNYYSCILHVLPGDKLTLTGAGATNGRLWAFADESMEITRRADEGAYLDDGELTVAENEKYFVYNALSTSNLHVPSLALKIDRAETLENLHADIERINDAITRYDCTALFKNGFYKTSETYIGAFTANESLRCCILRVLPGEKIELSGVGATNGRLWAFADDAKTITRRAGSGAYLDNGELTVAEGEKYFVFNAYATSDNHPLSLSITVDREKALEDLRTADDNFAEQIENIESRLSAVSAKNNLRTDGIDNLLPFSALVYKDGIASENNYGQDGARYLIDLGTFKKCHVRFSYQHTAFHPNTNGDVYVSLASLGKNNALHIEDLFKSIMTQGGLIYQSTFHYAANVTSGSSLILNPLFKKPLNGPYSVVIYYTGNEVITSGTTIDAVFDAGTLYFKVNGTTIGTVTITDSDTIQDFADAINAVDGFSCTVLNGNGTVADLLISDSLTVSMVDSATRNNATVYGTKAVIIPFSMDKSWHTVEFICDKEAQEAFVAYDGFTVRVGFTTAKALTDGMLAIGGNYTTNSGINVKDLVIDINTYGDCELLYGPMTNASATNTRQLISNTNPRLMIFEGHGILVGTEKQAQAAYQASGSSTSQEAMQASTERLNIVFNELKNRGYLPVTMQEVIDWKMGTGNLPKRCYLCIFDDYRIENYLDYDKRAPFVKNNVKATLALISDRMALADTIECNGQTYTVSDALDMVSKAGWYMASHTANHVNISQYTVSELLTMLKGDVLSCDTHKMNGNVLVYPFGGVSPASLKAVALSDFAIGISIVEEYYNCKASNDYRLIRTELGTRATLESVLAPFI